MFIKELIESTESAPLLQKFLADRNSLGLYIPAYQRPFSWGNEQFIRFFEDIATDIALAKEPPHYGLFMGFIICYDDSDKSYVIPGEKNKQPESVYNIVDGQQRTIFISVLSVLLHDLLGNKKYQKLVKDNKWLKDQVDALRDNLKRTFTVEIRRKHRPKLIRALKDQWSTSGDEEIFDSDIACFLNQYLESGQATCNHPKFMLLVNNLKALLHNFCKQRPPKASEKEMGYRLADVEDLLSNELLMKSIFSYDISKDYQKNKADPEDQEEHEELFRALLLGNYIYRCLHTILVVTRKSYDRTLTIFDELNSTGIPLNAFDTFKPEVYKLDILNYSKSEQEKYINRISADIERRKTRTETDKHVSDLIVSFALANSGEPIARAAFKQRNYLNSTFEPHVKEKKQCLKYLRFFSTVNDMKRIFDCKNNGGFDSFLREYMSKEEYDELQKDGDLRDAVGEASFCLSFLSKAGFTIAISLLSVYLHEVHTNLYNNPAILNFCKATRKTAAFFAVWRSSSETTNNVDDRIRRIMRDMSRHDYKNQTDNQHFSPDKLGQKYIGFIKEEYDIKNVQSWSLLIDEIPIYKVKQVARFILLTGSHNTRVGSKAALEVIPGPIPPIPGDTFDKDLFTTIEHILPKKEELSGLPKQEKDQLWNLTLVPADVNSMLGNKDWVRKQAIYVYYSAENKAEQEKALKKLREVLDKKQYEQFVHYNKYKHCGHLPTTRYLAKMQTIDFPTKKQLAKRTSAILENSWRILAEEWLGWPDKSNDR